LNPKQQVFINTPHIPQNIIISITNHGQAQAIQNVTSFSIVPGLFGMIMSINLNHKTQFRAVKINDKIRDGLLAQEFIAGKLAHAQDLMPHPDFGRGGGFPVFPG